MVHLFLVLSFLLLLSGRTAGAAEVSLEEEIELFQAEHEGLVVIAAAKYKQIASQAPASVTIITSEEIRQYGWKTLADLFRAVRSFYVSEDRNYSYLGIRGFSRPGDFNIRILALLNGHTLNDDIYQGFLLGRESGIDLDLVDRIEIVRGPGSALYGTSAFFAVVNIVTKEGKGLGGLRASAEAGSFNTNKGLLTFGKRYENGLDVVLHASYTASSGQTLFFEEYDDGIPEHNAGYVDNADAESVYSYFGTLRYRDFRLQGILFERAKEIPTASYGTVFNDGREESVDSRYFIELEYAPRLTQTLGLHLRLYDDWYRYKADYPYHYPPPVINKDDTPGRWYGAELRINWEILQRNRLMIGAEAQNHRVIIKNFDVDPFFYYVNDRNRFQVYSFYIQNELRLLHDLTLTVGIRQDAYRHYIEQEEQRVTPRTALVYEPVVGSLIKLLYGQAFRVPNSYELFYCGINFVCNPDLEPETIHTYEAVYEQTLNSYLKSSFSVYRYDIKNLINLTDMGGENIGFVNLERVRGAGAEAEFRAKWRVGLEGYINYTYQKTKNRETHDEISNSPNHIVKAGGVLPLAAEGVLLGLEAQYVGERKTVQPGESVDDYIVANLNLSFRNLYENLRIQFSVYNLFDAEYADPASEEHQPILRIPQNPRNFNVKITYLFP
jgi:iron complex outermembrane receptor protein